MTTAIRTNDDAIIYPADGIVSATTIPIYTTDVRRAKKNRMISFIQPLQASPKKSYYNLKRIESTYIIHGWVDRKYVDVNGFGTFTEGSSDYATLDYIMLNHASGRVVQFRWQDQTIDGALVDYKIYEVPDEMVGDEIRVELTFEMGAHL